MIGDAGNFQSIVGVKEDQVGDIGMSQGLRKPLLARLLALQLCSAGSFRQPGQAEGRFKEHRILRQQPPVSDGGHSAVIGGN